MALTESAQVTPEHFTRLDELEVKLSGLRTRLSGDRARQKMSESTVPSISGRVGQVMYGHWDTRQSPTATMKRNIEIAEGSFEQFKTDLKAYFTELSLYESDLEEAGVPYTPGRN